MAEDTINPKKYPTSSSEVSKMLGINAAEHNIPLASFSNGQTETAPTTAPSPANLPVAHTPIEEKIARAKAAADYGGGAENLTEDDQATANLPPALKIAKAAAPYIIVFGVGLFLYYFFFTGVNFGNIFKSTPKAATPKQSVLADLEKQDLANYQKWIEGYYYDISDIKVIDPEADNSGNGLSNFQKYLLNLNPKAYDSLGLGMADSEVLAKGLDPQTGVVLTDTQKSIVDKYVDMEVVMNRLTLYRLQHPEQVAGADTTRGGLFFPNPIPPAQAASNTAPQTGMYMSSPLNSNLDINTDIPGRLEIPSLKINVPLMWSKDPKSFDKDLQSGVIHYPGTALPGQIGTTYIAGHSSNYLWAKGNFNQVFATLGNLSNNTSFKITLVQKNGKDAILHYVVSRSQQYAPTDQSQFQNTGKSLVALSTCWPVGSTAERLVVFGELTQVEN